MQLPGMLVEYLINGSCALIWIWGIFELLNINFPSVSDPRLLLLVPGLYVVGMIVDHLAWLLASFKQVRERVKADSARAMERRLAGQDEAVDQDGAGVLFVNPRVKKAVLKVWDRVPVHWREKTASFLRALLSIFLFLVKGPARSTSPKPPKSFLDFLIGTDSFDSAKIILYSPDLGKEYVMRSSRDRIARGAFINTVLITVVFSPLLRGHLGAILPIGITFSVLCFSMWRRFEASTSEYRRRAIEAIEEKQKRTSPDIKPRV